MPTKPFIILMTMLILIRSTNSINTYAGLDGHITSVTIYREYKALVGKIDSRKAEITVKSPNYNIKTTPLFDPQNVSVGEHLDYRIRAYTDSDYDFSWLLPEACISPDGTISDLNISNDGKEADFIFHADPLPIQLSEPDLIGFKNRYSCEWTPVPYADTYQVSLWKINQYGKREPVMVNEIASGTSMNIYEEVSKAPGSYIYSVKALPSKETMNYMTMSDASFLDYDKSLRIAAEEIGYFGGIWSHTSAGSRYLLKKEDRTYPDQSFLSGGFYRVEGYYYSMDSDGYILSGWQNHGNFYSYHDNSGRAVTGFQTIQDSQYYFDPYSSIMTTGWVSIDGDYYYMSSDGRVVHGWKKINNERYYFLEDGKAATGNIRGIDGKLFCFDKQGRLIK